MYILIGTHLSCPLLTSLVLLSILAASSSKRPFFLATGFHKPHTPYRAPQSFYDLYPPAEKIPVAAHAAFPKDVSGLGWCVEERRREGGRGKERERETERDRNRDRETDTQRDRHTERRRDGETERIHPIIPRHLL